MTKRFENKIVVVTGATSGIGWETAVSFAREGATVIGTGRNQDRLDALSQEIDLALTVDVTSDAEVQMLADTVRDRYGRLDVLVNNAGIGLFKDWADTTHAEFENVLAVNLVGVVRVCQALLPLVLESDAGNVTMVSSVAGKRGYAKHGAYCASKHGLIGYSSALRADLKEAGVTVSVVCPPAVDTPFFENAGYMTFHEDHVGLTLATAPQIAEELLDAVANNEHERIITTRAKVLYAMSLVSPKLLEFVQRFK